MAKKDKKVVGETAGGGVVTSESLKETVIPPSAIELVDPTPDFNAEKDPLPEGVNRAEDVPKPEVMAKVNLKDDVFINGVKYAKGQGVLVPFASFDVWRHALAK